MSDVYEGAFDGTLTPGQLTQLIDLDAPNKDLSSDFRGLTLLAVVCKGGQLTIVKLLLDSGANPNALSHHKRPPLYFSTRISPPRDRALIVRALLDYGADINAQYPEDGAYTALMNAVTEVKDKDVVHELVDRGASLSVKNSQGQTVLQIAEGTPSVRDLRPKAAREGSWGIVIDLINGVIMFVIAYVNAGFLEDAVAGMVKKALDYSGEKAKDSIQHAAEAILGKDIAAELRARMDDNSSAPSSSKPSLGNVVPPAPALPPIESSTIAKVTESPLLPFPRQSPVKNASQAVTKIDTLPDAPSPLVAKADIFPPVNRPLVKNTTKEVTNEDPPAHIVNPPLGLSSKATQGDIANVFTPSSTGQSSVSEPEKRVAPKRAPPVTRPPPTRLTIEQFVGKLDDYVSKTGLERFFPRGSRFVQTLAQRAAELKDDPKSFPRTPENLKRLTMLSLYQPVIYCDDSGSMEGSRFSDQADIAARIARVATMIVPDDLGVELRFINNHAASAHTTAAEIIEKLKNTRPRGNTRIGTTLRKTILEPLVYSRIDRNQPLERPLLICTITDGAPDGEHESTFRDAIVECKQKLEGKGYSPTSVRFCVSQIGDESKAETFLGKLRDDQVLEEVLYCTTDQLDEKLKEMHANESRLEAWLLEVLTKPIFEREV